MNEYKKRIDWIDALKAFAIIMIVLGHCINGYSLVWHIVYGFHIPLFIILSGITFKSDNSNFSSFLMKKIKRIIIPYLIWGFISIIIYTVLGKYIDGDNKVTLINCLIGLFWANGENGFMRWNLPLWFLPTIFVIQIISYFINKFFVSKKNLIFVVIFEIVIALIIYNNSLLSNIPLGCETAIYLLPFFSFGNLISKYVFDNKFIDFIKKNSIILILVSFLLILLSFTIIISQKNIDYVSDQYRNYMLFITSSILMSISIIFIFISINKFNNYFLKIGKNTMMILVMHKFPIMFFINVFPFIKEYYLSQRLLVSILVTIISIFLCILIGDFIKKYIPWIFGEKKLKN